GNEKVELKVARGIIGKDSEGSRLSKITIKEKEAPPEAPANSNIVGLAYDIGPSGATFNPPIDLTVKYDPAELPAGLTENDLYLAWWDGSQWQKLESTVNTEANTISASISHFTEFAVIGMSATSETEEAKPATSSPDATGTYTVDFKDKDETPVVKEAGAEALAPPSTFSISKLSVSPTVVKVGEKVTVSVTVTNTGGRPGSYKVTLKVDDKVVESKSIKVGASSSKKLTFTTSSDAVGTYSVDVNGNAGTFTIVEGETVNWWNSFINKVGSWWGNVISNIGGWWKGLFGK
ncbi:CARDB domain-containing protein, partial [Chloroflexota bacterium]